MKAAVFYGKKDIRYQESDSQVLLPEEVLIRIHACGVCGTDLHVYDGAEGSATVTPPIILGHEFAGEVFDVGSAVQRVKIGDRVCIDPNIFCGECQYCRTGKAHLCEDLQAIGVTRSGGFAEYCPVPVKQVYSLPDSLDFEDGALAEPVACCVHGMDLAKICAGDRVLILGAGTIGLILLQLVRIAGAAKIFVSEPVAAKRDLANTLGADLAIDPMTEDLMSIIDKQTHGGVDVAIECVGKSTTMTQAIQALRRGGSALLFGLAPPNCEIPLRPFDLFKRELTIRSSFVNPFTQARAVALLASKKIQLKPLISDRFPLAKINEIFANKKYRQRGKVIVEPA